MDSDSGFDDNTELMLTGMLFFVVGMGGVGHLRHPVFDAVVFVITCQATCWSIFVVSHQ